MNLSEKLWKLIDEHNLTRAKLAKETGLPYTTIDSILKRTDFDKVKLSTLKVLKEYFNVSLDYLIVDGEESKDSLLSQELGAPSDVKAKASNNRIRSTDAHGLSISQSAYEVAQAYDAAEPRARESVRYALNLPPESEKGRRESVPVEISEIDAEVEAYRQELLAEKEAAAKPEASPTTKGA